MATLPNRQLMPLRQIAQGRGPPAQVRLASTSWWHGDVSVTRDMNALRRAKMIRMWRDAARNQQKSATLAGISYVRAKRDQPTSRLRS